MTPIPIATTRSSCNRWMQRAVGARQYASALNEAQTEIQQIIYDPSKSSALRSLETGAKIQDGFAYEIADRSGATSSGYVIVEVTGEERVLTILPLDAQFTTTGVATGSIPVSIEDPDGDLSDVELTAAAENSSLVPPGGIEIVNTGGAFSMAITPAAAANGRTSITLTARNGDAQTAMTRFLLVVGTETDLDLDGVQNEVEDAAPQGGDMNQDGVADSRQAHVTSARMRDGVSFVNVAVPENQVLLNVLAEDCPEPAAPASGAQFPIGLLQFDVVAESSGAASTLTIRTDYSTSALNRVFQFDGPVGQASEGETTGGQGWLSLMYNKRDGARVFADRVVVNLRDGGRGDFNTVADGLIRTSVALGHVAHPWQNLVREDVDNDGVVAPIDVLLLVNQLNNFGSRFLGAFPTGDQSMPNFLDPSGNDSLEPIDALIVINLLNNRAAGAEGESATRVDSAGGLLSLASMGLPADVNTELQESSRERAGHQHLGFGRDLPPFHSPSPAATDLQRTTDDPKRDRLDSQRFAADLDALLAQGELADVLGLIADNG